MAILENLLASEIDLSADVLRLEFEDDAGHRHHIPMKGGVAGALLVALIDRLGKRAQAHSGRMHEEQALQLRGATAMSFETGKPGLLLQLDGDLRFALALDRDGIGRLRSALSQCDALVGPREGRTN